MKMNICHAATIAAYPIKEELGGGFRGAYKAIGYERVASDRFDTLEQAKLWAQKMACELHAGARLAAYRRKGEYKANVWVPA
jgi:hypothetical protein